MDCPAPLFVVVIVGWLATTEAEPAMPAPVSAVLIWSAMLSRVAVALELNVIATPTPLIFRFNVLFVESILTVPALAVAATEAAVASPAPRSTVTRLPEEAAPLIENSRLAVPAADPAGEL